MSLFKKLFFKKKEYYDYFVLVKDNKILCEEIFYYTMEREKIMQRKYFTRPFKLFRIKKEVKEYYETEDVVNHTNSHSLIFDSIKSAVSFLEKHIDNKDDFHVVQIKDLDIPDEGPKQSVD